MEWVPDCSVAHSSAEVMGSNPRICTNWKSIRLMRWRLFLIRNITTTERQMRTKEWIVGQLGGKKRIRECIPFLLWSIWIPPCSHSFGKREWAGEIQGPCLRSVGFGFLPAPFLKAPPLFRSALWINNPMKSTQSITSPTVNKTSVYVWVLTVSLTAELTKRRIPLR